MKGTVKKNNLKTFLKYSIQSCCNIYSVLMQYLCKASLKYPLSSVFSTQKVCKSVEGRTKNNVLFINLTWISREINGSCFSVIYVVHTHLNREQETWEWFCRDFESMIYLVAAYCKDMISSMQNLKIGISVRKMPMQICHLKTKHSSGSHYNFSIKIAKIQQPIITPYNKFAP